jgi:hypothetical protein
MESNQINQIATESGITIKDVITLEKDYMRVTLTIYIDRKSIDFKIEDTSNLRDEDSTINGLVSLIDLLQSAKKISKQYGITTL